MRAFPLDSIPSNLRCLAAGFLCISNIVFDAFIACWEAKRFYDTSRPWTVGP